MLHAVANRQTGRREHAKGAGKHRMLKVGSKGVTAFQLQPCSLQGRPVHSCSQGSMHVCCLA